MKHVKQMVVHYRKDFEGNDEYFLMLMDMSGMGYVPVCTVTVEFETPDDFNPVAAQVEALNREKAAITKAFTDKVSEINDRISKLQAIGCEVSA